MYFLFMRFIIPNDKIYEFDLAFRRLVKWPIYTLYKTNADQEQKTFELIRHWENREEMNRELVTREFSNMIGMVKVLGKVLQSDVYEVVDKEDVFQMSN